MSLGLDVAGGCWPPAPPDASHARICSQWSRQASAGLVGRSIYLVHSDLCGPMKHSNSGAQYNIIYIDDCTRYTEVYYLVTKSAEEISAKFRHYQARVEAQGFHFKRFRSDNGSGEYSNSMFLGILGEKEITYEPSPPYTQHKNGTAERMIQTLNTKARSMM